MKKTTLALAMAIAMMFALPLAAAANPCADTFVVYNQGAHTIVHLYVSPPDESSWPPDLLGQYVLNPGYDYRPLYSYYGADCDCATYQDVEAIYTDGTVRTDMEVDICRYNVSFSY